MKYEVSYIMNGERRKGFVNDLKEFLVACVIVSAKMQQNLSGVTIRSINK